MGIYTCKDCGREVEESEDYTVDCMGELQVDSHRCVERKAFNTLDEVLRDLKQHRGLGVGFGKRKRKES